MVTDDHQACQRGVVWYRARPGIRRIGELLAGVRNPAWSSQECSRCVEYSLAPELR